MALSYPAKRKLNPTLKLVSCLRSSRHNSRVIPSENLPFPSLAKRGENHTEKNPPLKKGDKGGFEFNFSGCHHLDFLNELLRRHSRSPLNAFRSDGLLAEQRLPPRKHRAGIHPNNIDLVRTSDDKIATETCFSFRKAGP